MTNYEKAVEIHERSGADAIYEACENGTLDHEAWLRCAPCEAITPFAKSTCLICGTNKEEV